MPRKGDRCFWILHCRGDAAVYLEEKISRTHIFANKTFRFLIHEEEGDETPSVCFQDARDFREIVLHIRRKHMGEYGGQKNKIEAIALVREFVARSLMKPVGIVIIVVDIDMAEMET